MSNKVYARLASLLQAIQNCQQSDNLIWKEKHEEALRKIMNTAPSGSGIDCGTGEPEFFNERNEKIKFHVSFHHMNEVGYYDGWTEHEITVRPSFIGGITLSISGRDRNGIKDYLHDVYHCWLTSEVDTSEDVKFADKINRT